MKKSHALRRRVLALVAALFLISIFSVSTFAVSNDGNYVKVNGLCYFNSDIVLANYFEYETTYSGVSGYYQWYSSDGTLNETQYNSFYVTYDTSYYLCLCQYDGVGAASILKTANDTEGSYEDVVFNAVVGRYLYFTDFEIQFGDEIYELLTNEAAVTSTLTFTPSGVSGTNIVSFITGAFNGVLTGFGSGTADFFETIFVDADGSLTTFALVGLVFLGVGLSVGIARWVIKKVGQ